MQQINAEKNIWIFGLVVSIFSTVGFLMSLDVYQISKWSIKLLDCMSRLHPGGYVAALYEGNHMGSNYNILVNMLNALWELPLYLLARITHHNFSLEIYGCWLNFLILLAYFLCLYVLWHIFESLGFNERAGYQGMILFSASTFLQWGALAMGQIDLIGTAFFFIFIRFLLIKKYDKAMLFASCAVVFKGLVLLFILPIILLLFGAEIKKMLRSLAVFCVIPLLSKLIELCFFPGYGKMVRLANGRYEFGNLFFEYNIFGASNILIAFAVILFICWYKAINKKVFWYDYLLMPLAAFCAFVTYMQWHPQWLVCGVIFLVAAALCFKKKIVFHLLYFGTNLSYLIFIVCTYRTYEYNKGTVDNNMLTTSLLGKIITHFRGYAIVTRQVGEYFEAIIDTPSLYARTILISCLILLLGLAYAQIHNEKDWNTIKGRIAKISFVNEADDRANIGILVLQFLPIVAMDVFSYALYFLKITA